VAGSDVEATVDGTGTAASFQYPSGMHVIGSKGYLFDGFRLRTIDLGTNVVDTIAGSGNQYSGCTDSTDPAQTGLTGSAHLTDDGTFLYWIDTCANAGLVRRMALDSGAISTVVPLPGYYWQGSGLSTGPDGSLYLAWANTISRVDTVNNTLTTISTLASGAKVVAMTGDADALWVTATSNCPNGECGAIYRVDPVSGAVTAVQAMTTSGQALHGNGPVVSSGAYLYGKVSGATARYISATNPTVYDPLSGMGRWTKSTGELVLLRDSAGGPLWTNGAQLDVSGVSVSGSSVYVSSANTHGNIASTNSNTPRRGGLVDLKLWLEEAGASSAMRCIRWAVRSIWIPARSSRLRPTSWFLGVGRPWRSSGPMTPVART
jgi:hypothetical protein